MKTNDLRHVIETKDEEGNSLKIEVTLNDECKNGHQDFSITATGWLKGKPRTDKNMIYAGCCHEEILRAAPELKIFVDLHLSDAEGVPIYAVENGFYHLRNGFNRTKTEDKTFKNEFCDYYRITPAQFDRLNESRNKLQYALLLRDLGILEQWRNQANEAIKLLETLLTGGYRADTEALEAHRFINPS